MNVFGLVGYVITVLAGAIVPLIVLLALFLAGEPPAIMVGKDAIVVRDGLQVTEFQEGILPWSVQRPVALLFDEYDAGRPDVMFVIQRVLEAAGSLTLLDQTRVIRPHPYFRLFATTNTVGLGDTTGLYHGTQQINQGQMDRWSLVVTLNYLPAETERAIVEAKLGEYGKTEAGRAQIADMVKVADLTREAFINGDMGLPLRLLARELYDRVVKAKGAGAAALITGEEKIVPPKARYFLCTVEAMPLDIRPAFMAKAASNNPPESAKSGPFHAVKATRPGTLATSPAITAPAPIVTSKAGRAQQTSVDRLAKSASAGPPVSRKASRITTPPAGKCRQPGSLRGGSGQ